MNNKELRSINPATLEEVGVVTLTPPAKVNEMVRKAQSAYPSWRDAGLEKRALILKQVQQQLLDHSEEFARLITSEMGRPINESLGLEVLSCIDIMGYYVKNAIKFLGDKRVPLHHVLFKRRKSLLHFESLGVLGIISPWNWPLLIPMGSIVPALLSGNAVVFKPSELTPILAAKMQELFVENGVPAEIFQIIQGGAEQGIALIDSSVVKVFFTGSTRVGNLIYKSASKKLKKCVLEMGGSDPAIVCEDADIDFASSGVLWGGFSNSGQNCNSIERVFVHQDIFNSFLEKMVSKVKDLRIGNGKSTEIDFGPLASLTQLDKMKRIVNQSRKAGDEIVTGGHPISNFEGYFFEPTIIVRDASHYQEDMEELFGPIVFITPVSGDEEAITLANSSNYGLASSVWTSDKKRGMQIACYLEAGTVMINDVIVSFGMTEAGWTGIKQSGIGWVHGEKGLDEMVNIKYINRDPQDHTQKFWWFNYSQVMIQALKAALQVLYATSFIRRLANLLPVLKRMSSYMLFNRRRSDKL